MARHRLSLPALSLLAGVMVSASFSTVGAQPTRRTITPPPESQRFMVPVFRSQEKGPGLQVANALRDKLTSDIPIKEIWVIPKTEIENSLTPSGYPIDVALPRGDIKVLANLVRADEYLEGGVTKTGDKFRVEPVLVLARDNKLTQPLPVAEGSLSQVSSQIAKSVREARKQIKAEKECRLHSTDRPPKWPQAIAAAQAGIAAYPQATLARLCKANAFVGMGAPADSVLAVVTEILAIEPKNAAALQLAVATYETANMKDERYLKALMDLLGTDPTNAQLKLRVVNAIAGMGKPELAAPIIKQAVAENPGDPELIRLQWLVLLAASQWKEAIAAGEEMIKTDTAVADTTFFDKLTRAYLSDSQPQKAAEAAARGIAKFPSNHALLTLYPQVLIQSGQTAQAIIALRKAMAAGVKGLYPTLVKAYTDSNQPDSLFALLREGRTAGEDPTLIAGVALQQGNAAYKVCGVSKTAEDCNKALAWLSFSDTVKTSTESKFLLGATAFTYGMDIMQKASASKSCDEAKLTQDMLLIAQINIPAGGAKYPEQAKQLMDYLTKYGPTGEQMVKQFCKGEKKPGVR